MAIDLNEHEVGFVKSFVMREKRARALELLAKPGTRVKQLGRLDHTPDLDPRFCVAIPPSTQSESAIAMLLRRAGAPNLAYVLSTQAELDGRHLSLDEALARVVGGGMGSIISCIPGELAYYEPEEGRDRCILRRPAR